RSDRDWSSDVCSSDLRRLPFIGWFTQALTRQVLAGQFLFVDPRIGFIDNFCDHFVMHAFGFQISNDAALAELFVALPVCGVGGEIGRASCRERVAMRV